MQVELSNIHLTKSGPFGKKVWTPLTQSLAVTMQVHSNKIKYFLLN